MPFTGLFSRFLSQRFRESTDDIRTYIQHVPSPMTEEALLATSKEVECLLLRVCALSLKNIKDDPLNLKIPQSIQQRLAAGLPADKTFLESYEAIKSLEGEILEFAGEMQTHTLTLDQTHCLHRYLNAARHGVYAAKAMKDIRENLAVLRHAEQLELRDYYDQQRTLHRAGLTRLLLLLCGDHTKDYLREEIISHQDQNLSTHKNIEDQVFAMGLHKGANELETSTILNVNREFRESAENLFKALELLRVV